MMMMVAQPLPEQIVRCFARSRSRMAYRLEKRAQAPQVVVLAQEANTSIEYIKRSRERDGIASAVKLGIVWLEVMMGVEKFHGRQPTRPEVLRFMSCDFQIDGVTRREEWLHWPNRTP